MEDIEKNMTESLVAKATIESPKRWTLTWDSLAQEVKRQSYIAAPMVAVILSTFLLNVISMMMVGHLGELALSSTAIAVSISAVTGFSLLNGMASALETLCGQAFGAQQYRKLGNQTYGAIFSLILVASLVSILWINMGKVLVLTGQDPVIAHESGRFATWLVPALFAYAVFQPMIRFFQVQSMIIPMLVCCSVTLVLHIPLCWVLVYKTELRNVGGALAISISNWLNVIFLSVYMKFSPACAKTRVPISMEFFQGIGEFFRFAIPSAVMVCLQWWSYELVILLSGFLPNPQLETSVLSVCLTTISTLYAIPSGLSAAVSTRVSNELGAGNPEAAKIAVHSIMLIAVPELLVVSGTLLAIRQVFGYTFSSELEVVEYVDTMAPFVCISVIVDGLQGVLSGVARGCGWQNVGAYINLASLYLCGVPAAAILGFWLQLKARGLWVGNQIGAILQTIVLSLVIIYTNWDNQAKKARERMFAGRRSTIENVY